MTQPLTLPLILEPSIATNLTETLRFAFFRSIEAAGRDWDASAPAHDIFLQRPYLSVLEANPPVGMRFGYLVFYKNESPIGVALCQIKYFKGDDNIADLDVPRKDPCFFGGLAQWFKRWVAGKAAADILICGNMLLTGEHGYYFDYQSISHTQAMELLEKALDNVIEQMGREGIKMPVILVKDIAPENQIQGKFLVGKGFTEFDIQPNMVLNLPFRDMEEYLATMSTKYRTRAKRAFKKLDGIERRELTHAEIQQELPTIYHLYREIANNAGFNMVDLNEQYLAALERDLGEYFRMFAYYLDGKLIAFYTTIRNHDELEAHFLGYEKALNHDYQLYLNILYDIIKIGLDTGCKSIVFARTALEIKSSVGAVAQELSCYLRHQHPVVNKFAPTILDYLKPVEQWQPRHPFKEEG
ncbi:MAG: GNAT family N-acetyltransferase [Lewinellaceae bacterium]|nr:GNAT family N-acetyltransferase [Lewinellaceae bacterium]